MYLIYKRYVYVLSDLYIKMHSLKYSNIGIMDYKQLLF